MMVIIYYAMQLCIRCSCIIYIVVYKLLYIVIVVINEL